MGNFNVKINYLYNSGFTVETENNLLIFDYCLDEALMGVKNRRNGTVGIEDLRINKDVLVFSSHSHSDHFNPVILEWRKVRPDINYILSSDIGIDIEVESNNDKLYHLSAKEELRLKDVSIKAFGSTDIGISFLVRVDGVDIFHAGDLNWWHWWDEPDKENLKAEKMFKLEIEKLRGNNVDIAFFPVDQRLKSYYFFGGEYFIKEMTPKIFIPMHFRENFEITKKFAGKFNTISTRIIELSSRGQEIIL
jgi:L-ascorbate metabolism protein UlaG (beta-lactamase superfamily)